MRELNHWLQGVLTRKSDIAVLNQPFFFCHLQTFYQNHQQQKRYVVVKVTEFSCETKEQMGR